MAKKPESKLDTDKSKEKLDAVSESHASGIVDSIEKNRVIVISSAIAFFVLLGLFLVGKQMGAQRHLKAGQMFTTAAASRSIDELDKVVKEYSGSVSAGNALLSKADIQIDQGKPLDAIATLTEMATQFAGHPRHAQAYFMLANIYHKTGDLAKARENYEEVLKLQPDGEFSPITRIRIGDLELAEGNIDKARQNYEESYTIHPGNPFFSTAERRIAQLDLVAPTEIDPPKPEAAAAKPKDAAPAPAAEKAAAVENEGDEPATPEEEKADE
ncbi:MAG: tetratricopeptide repeat protein [Verrucomicrobiales bacterium]|nr:tetratricopeptide repeat protein [Verrucomicrobiales bacterium]